MCVCITMHIRVKEFIVQSVTSQFYGSVIKWRILFGKRYERYENVEYGATKQNKFFGM